MANIIIIVLQISEETQHPPLIIDKNDSRMLFEDGVVKPEKRKRVLQNPKVLSLSLLFCCPTVLRSDVANGSASYSGLEVEDHV